MSNIVKIVLVRHGESTWNAENRFTGWTDVPLSEKGITEAHAASNWLKNGGYNFDIAYTSVLKRANKTLNIILEDMELLWLPVEKSWRLNERHYGDLQGLDKSETAAKHGEDQVKIWRRAYDIAPPPLNGGENDPRYPGKDPRYANLTKDQIPLTECLKDTVERFLPLWKDTIAPVVKSGKKVIIAAHGNSIRALIKYLDNVPDNEIVDLNIPTAIPLVYELDAATLKPIRHYYLATDEEVKKAIEAVANQGKKK